MKIEEKYHNYSAADLLKDNRFLCWLLNPNEESNNFWDKQQKKDPDLKRNIEAAIQIFHSIRINQPELSDEEETKIFSTIYLNYKRNRIKKRIYLYTTAAACILVAIAVSFWFTQLYNEHCPLSEKTAYIPTTPSSVDFNKLKNVEIAFNDKEKITIEDDAAISLNSDKTLQIEGDGKEYQLKLNSYSNYTKLLVPYGRRSFLSLPDGTKLWINSGTEVRFPNSMDSKKRNIFIDGEIYIEVAHNSKRPFYVHTSDMNIRVYGTKFNVTSYHNDITKSVALIEGSISVYSNKMSKNTVMLTPNQEYAQSSNGFSVQKVNAANFMSWKDGLWIFTNEELSSLALRLTRYYGQTIECAPDISQKSCTGKLVLFKDIHTTMETISDILSVRCLSINNIIYIKSK
ncbi:MAG: FecR family protein [Bacteroides sp.]|jgi:ferric-dicitrate binding protein FerR (iron transport regulator)|nr:FecR family protein [Bacteroides sp.]MCI1682206.1 FecR family protein [Bacteroides sp.]